MPKSYKKPSIVSGMSLNDILNMDMETFNKLGVSDMRKVVGRLVSAGNKRLRSFEKAGENSPAVRQVNRSGGAFSTKGKDLNALRAEYTRAKNFLTAPTGSRKGWSKVKKDTIKTLKKSGIEINEELFDTFWKTYEELKELNPEISNKRLKYKFFRAIADMIVDTDLEAEEIVQQLHNRVDAIYEEMADIENGKGGVSDFFEI